MIVPAPRIPGLARILRLHVHDGRRMARGGRTAAGFGVGRGIDTLTIPGITIVPFGPPGRESAIDGGMNSGPPVLADDLDRFLAEFRE